MVCGWRHIKMNTVIRYPVVPWKQKLQSRPLPAPLCSPPKLLPLKQIRGINWYEKTLLILMCLQENIKSFLMTGRQEMFCWKTNLCSFLNNVFIFYTLPLPYILHNQESGYQFWTNVTEDNRHQRLSKLKKRPYYENYDRVFFKSNFRWIQCNKSQKPNSPSPESRTQLTTSIFYTLIFLDISFRIF